MAKLEQKTQWNWCVEEKDENDYWQIADKGKFFASSFAQALKQLSAFVSQPVGVDWQKIDESFQFGE